MKQLRRARKRLHDWRQALFMRSLRRRGNFLEPDCLVPRGSEIGTRFRVGRGTTMSGPLVIQGGEMVTIGRYCLFGRGVRIFSSNHRIDAPAVQYRLQLATGRDADRPGPLTIGSGAWIGENAIILGGVRIGEGAVVGAASVVTGDVAPFAVVVGAPAREVRKRFGDEVIAELLALAWWDWPAEKIAAEPAFFGADLTACRVADVYPAAGSATGAAAR